MARVHHRALATPQWPTKTLVGTQDAREHAVGAHLAFSSAAASATSNAELLGPPLSRRALFVKEALDEAASDRGHAEAVCHRPFSKPSMQIYG